MASIPITQLSLLVRLRDARDREAWERFVDLYAPLVFGFVRKRGLQEADAADLTQDVLRQVAQSAKSLVYDPKRGSFRAWLFTVVRNRLTDHWRATGWQAAATGDSSQCWNLSLKLALWPMLVMAAVLGVLLVLIVGETGTRNLSSFLGFCVLQLAMTLALCSAFYCAWHTAGWIVWIGAMLFLPASGSALLGAAAYQHAPLATWLSCGLQSVLAFAFWFVLLFVRPLLIRSSGNWMSERLTGWQRLFAIACFTIVGTPLVFQLMYYSLSFTPRPRLTEAPLLQPSDQRTQPVISSGNGIPSLPDRSPAREKTISEAVKPLLGRWMVVSSEGPALGSATMMGMSTFGSASPGGMGAAVSGSPMLAGGGDDSATIDGEVSKTNSSPLQMTE